MSSELFGTDGIRGPVGRYPLNRDGMIRIGKAVGTYFSDPGGKILVGWDPRESSESLVGHLVEGLLAVGVEVRRVGIIPTPGLSYLTRQPGVKAGVMITASHNPYTDNGVKVFTPDGRKLSDKDQIGLNRMVDAGVPDRGVGKVSNDKDAARGYERFLAVAAGDVRFKGLKIAIDTANGATSGIGARVFRSLGADVTAVSDKPDGRNINVKCGATDPAALQSLVKSKHQDAGIALDGDGDRVILVDSKGRRFDGDHMLYLLAVTSGHDGVVATIMSNQGLQTALESKGISFARTPVGDRAVLEALDKTGYGLGGEQSGHIIISEMSPTGDGLLAAVCTLACCMESGKSLAEWYDELKLLPQSLVSVPFPDKHLLESRIIQGFLSDEEDKLSGRGRLNVRPSGTEPLVRVMVESPDAEERAKRIAEKLTELAGAGA